MKSLEGAKCMLFSQFLEENKIFCSPLNLMRYPQFCKKKKMKCKYTTEKCFLKQKWKVQRVPQSQTIANPSDTKREEVKKTKLRIHNEQTNGREASRLALSLFPKRHADPFLCWVAEGDRFCTHWSPLSATVPIVVDGHHCWSPMGKVRTQAFVKSFAGNIND